VARTRKVSYLNTPITLEKYCSGPTGPPIDVFLADWKIMAINHAGYSTIIIALVIRRMNLTSDESLQGAWHGL
jgi:hypothetical protein